MSSTGDDVSTTVESVRVACPRLQDVHARSFVGLGIHAQYLCRYLGLQSLVG